jgi:adenosylcobinamide-phosphate synthase
MIELLSYALLTIIIALLFDRFIGEPPNALHPVVWMGKAISFFDDRISRGHPVRERTSGALMALFVIVIFSFLALLLMAVVREALGLLAWSIVGGVLLKTMFAMSAMGKHTEPVRQALLAGVDSIFSPLFYFGLLGLPAAVAYRASNTLDAMVGYLNDRHRYVGWFSAKLDDCTNWLMARASVPFILLALLLLGKDWRAGWASSRKYHDQTLSPNKGWHMSAFAGGLGIRFEKIGWYVMGDGALPSDPEGLRDTIKVMTMASYLFVLTVVVPLYVMVGVELQVFVENLLLGMIGV